jgi:hypothetical protein
MNYQTVVDGFAKKLAGLSGSNTWNDIYFDAMGGGGSSPYDPWLGSISGAATISGTGATKTLALTGAPFAIDDPDEYRFPDKFKLMDNTTDGIVYIAVTKTSWIYTESYVMSFVITFRALP